MNNFKQKSNKNDGPGEDDDLFDDSSIMAHFENNSFKDRSNFSKSVINDSLNNSHNSFNVSALCCDEEISGYDRLTGKTWIYPTNYPVRDYQFNIIRAALMKNTLVSLPTGLGKTFIAAVIMYNFYRWYPLGKIVFTAPTRPLVAQQIDACYNIIAIPPSDTIEMTGHMPVNTRKLHWQTKRVFFATPQVIYNDIKSGICPGDKIRCLVVDEAHRARGNYAYCQIVSTLTEMKHKTYRMLALSATPGSKVDDVINVVKHLNIAHLELRTENCIDVAPYSHSRKINTVVVQLGPELTQLRTHYVEILDGYARRLKQMNILPHNIGNLSKGRIVMLYKEYQGKERGSRHPQHNYIMKDFTLLIALYHGLELLVKHGARVFLNFFDDHPEKSWLQADDRLTALLERLRDDLGVNPMALDTSVLPDGSIPDVPKDLHFGHPKFDRLKEIMLEHFQAAKRNGQDTKAIVFCEYRESVNLVHCLLLQCRPLIVPQMFVGQGASGKDNKPVVSQKQQLRVMRQFREGACNALVATCVCEEGLDVGSVDLILCFDISTASPVRLVQRCGRTGRERGGKVFILVTEGREHQTLMDCMRRRDGLNAKILQSKDVANNLYKANPRMMPHDLTPVCKKMFITVQKNETKDTKAQTDKAKKNQKDLRSMLTASTSSSTSANTVEGAGFITKSEFQEIFPDGYQETDYLPKPKEVWAMGKEMFKDAARAEGKLNLSTWLEWQRNPQNTVKVEHSTDTQVLTSLLQYSDAKRFDLPPSTQNPTFSTQNLATQNFSTPTPEKPKPPKKTKKAPVIKSPVKRCGGDIRALFSTATKSTKNYTKLINDLGIQNDGSIPTSLINLLVDLRLDNEVVRNCLICQNICDCTFIENIRKHRKKVTKPLFLTNLILPDINLIDDLDAETLMAREKTINNSQDLFEDYKDSTYMEVKNNCSNFDLEFDFGSPDKIANSDDKVAESVENTDKNFDLGDIEEIFADSSPEEAIIKEAEAKNDSDPKEALGFFGLDSIEDIFGESDESRLEALHAKENKTEINENNNHVIDQVDKFKVQVTESEIVCPVSPSILSGQMKTSKKPETSPTSPILCTQVRKFQLSTKRNQPTSSTPLGNAKRQLIPPTTSTSSNVDPMIYNKSDFNVNSKSVTDTTNKSMFTITQLVEMINNKTDRSITQANISKTLEEPKVMEEDDRSTSPILLTQAVRKRTAQSLNNSIKSNNSVILDKKAESLIVLDSDRSSDSNEATQMYDIEDLKNYSEINESKIKEPFRSPLSNKRKLSEDDDVTLNASPYFNKRQKFENHEKPLTLQEKVLAALNRSQKPDNHDSSVNFMFSQKENENPQENIISPKDEVDKEKYVNRMNLEMLQAFRRDSQVKNPKRLFEDSRIRKVSLQRRRPLSDSDDDFVNDDRRSQRPVVSRDSHKSTTNHKVRKKKAGNSFLEIEAEESDDASGSDDEHSDDSVGSIVDFICDEPVSHSDIQAHYMRAVTGTVNGAFKIPELPTRFKREEIFSQFVEEDSYEMDSFCVDSHIGLTQVNDVSELELAEIILEERKAKKQSKPPKRQVDTTTNGDSPLVIRKKKSAIRQIQSDSDDSS